MAREIRITAGGVTLDAELNDTKTAGSIWDSLPIQSNGSTWGEEIYFEIPVYAELENGQEVVECRSSNLRKILSWRRSMRKYRWNRSCSLKGAWDAHSRWCRNRCLCR